MRPSIWIESFAQPLKGITGQIERIVLTSKNVTDEVQATEKLKARKMGSRYFLELHVQAEPALSLRDSHVLSGKVKRAIRSALPGLLTSLRLMIRSSRKIRSSRRVPIETIVKMPIAIPPASTE